MPPLTSTHDSPFGSWTFARWSPSALRGAVDVIWYFDGSTAFPRELVFPNGVLELVVSLDGADFVVEHDGHARECPRVNVSGLQLRPMVVVSPLDRVRVLGIRLRPSAAGAVLGRVVPDLVSSTADLNDVVGSAAAELADRCRVAPTPDACLRVAASWLSARIARAAPADPAITWIIRRIDEAHGGVPISQLREQCGLSRNRLATAFRQHVGVAPKAYARIRRFDHAMRLMQARPITLSALALQSGYYDQAHMTAEFGALAGRTPATFVSAVRYPESLNLAER